MMRYTDVYLQFARAKQYRDGGNMTLVSATSTPPTRRPAGTVLVKLKVQVPDEAFDPAAIPSLIADIPLESVLPALDEIEAVIEDPS